MRQSKPHSLHMILLRMLPEDFLVYGLSGWEMNHAGVEGGRIVGCSSRTLISFITK